MRRPLALIAAATLLLSLGAASSAAASPRSGELSADPNGRWIVVLKPGSDATAPAASQGRKVGFSVDRTFGHVLRGYAARLTRSQVGTLERDPAVEEVVPDERIQSEGQIIPTGISRIGAL